MVSGETKLVANTKHSDEGYVTMTTKKEAWSTTIHDLLKKYVDLSVPSDKSAVFCPTENWPMEAMRRLLTFE